jgi:hypothetical protein
MTLAASLTIDPLESQATERFVATCRLMNVGEGAVDINAAAFSSPSLALEIQDMSETPVLLPPPPVPPLTVQTELLEPGHERVAQFAGFLPSWTEPGAYRARCRYASGPGEPVVSDWVSFLLKP